MEQKDDRIILNELSDSIKAFSIIGAKMQELYSENPKEDVKRKLEKIMVEYNIIFDELSKTRDEFIDLVENGRGIS